jgi:Tfp pilus assembly protein PilF
MSIIHQALKKAAAEGQITPNKSTILKSHAAKSFPPRSRFLIFLFGLILLVSFVFSAKRIWPILQGSFPTADSAKEVKTSTASERNSRQLPADRSTQNPSSTEPTIVPDGDNGGIALTEGLNFYNQGKMELANDRFEKAVSLLPLSAVAHNNLGLTFRHQGKIREAMEHYEEAIRLDSDYAEAHNNLGMAYDQLGSIDQAASYYQKAIRFKPTVPEFHLNYATWLERKGDFVKARQEYQRYLSLETDTSSDGMTNQQKESVVLVKNRLKELKGF